MPSRRTCQTLWRVTFVADVARTNPLIQNFASFEICHLFKRDGWHRVVEDDDIGIRLSNCQSSVLSMFPIDHPKLHSGTHSKQFEKVPLPTLARRQVRTMKNTVYRPSFTSILLEIRPG